MLKKVDIKVYYGKGMSFVALGENVFYAISDDGQKRFVTDDLPPGCKESYAQADNLGNTSSSTRTTLEAVCTVAQAITDSYLSPSQT